MWWARVCGLPGADHEITRKYVGACAKVSGKNEGRGAEQPSTPPRSDPCNSIYALPPERKGKTTVRDERSHRQPNQGVGKVDGQLSDLRGDLACWCGCGATRAVTMKVSNQPRHQRGRAAVSSSAMTALSRQPLREVLEGVEDPRDRWGVRHPLVSVLCLAVTGLAGCRSLTAIWNRPTRGPGPGGGAGPAVGVHDPQGPEGPGPRGPRRPRRPPGSSPALAPSGAQR